MFRQPYSNIQLSCEGFKKFPEKTTDNNMMMQEMTSEFYQHVGGSNTFMVYWKKTSA